MGEFGAVVLLEVSAHGPGGGSVIPALRVRVLGLDGHTMETHVSRSAGYSYYSLPDVTSSQLLSLPPVPVRLSDRFQHQLVVVIESARQAAKKDKSKRRDGEGGIGFQKTPAWLGAALVVAAQRALDLNSRGEEEDITGGIEDGEWSGVSATSAQVHVHGVSDTGLDNPASSEDEAEDTLENHNTSPASLTAVLLQQRVRLKRSAASPTISGLVDAAQEKALLQALDSAHCHHREALTDVGRHTGSTPRPTAAPLAEALFFSLLQEVQTEQVSLQGPTKNSATDSLPAFADRAAVWGLSDAGGPGISPFFQTCSRDRDTCSGDPETCTGIARACHAAPKSVLSTLKVLRSLYQAEGMLQLRQAAPRLPNVMGDVPHAALFSLDRASADLPYVAGPASSASPHDQNMSATSFLPDGDGLAAGVEAVHWLLSTASRATDTLLDHAAEESALHLFLCTNVIPRCERIYEALRYAVDTRYEEAAARLTLAQPATGPFTDKELSSVGQPISVPPGTLPEALHFKPIAGDEIRQMVRRNVGGFPIVGMGMPGQPRRGLALGSCLRDWAEALTREERQMQTAAVVVTQTIDAYLWTECSRLANDTLWQDITVGLYSACAF